jgi:hypothetical protein
VRICSNLPTTRSPVPFGFPVWAVTTTSLRSAPRIAAYLGLVVTNFLFSVRATIRHTSYASVLLGGAGHAKQFYGRDIISGVFNKTPPTPILLELARPQERLSKWGPIVRSARPAVWQDRERHGAKTISTFPPSAHLHHFGFRFKPGQSLFFPHAGKPFTQPLLGITPER